MIYGAVIDSTCLVLQQSCSRKGACLLYDHDTLRFRLHVLPLCAQVMTVVLKAAAWQLSRRRYRTTKYDGANTITVNCGDTAVTDKPEPGTEDGKFEQDEETSI